MIAGFCGGLLNNHWMAVVVHVSYVSFADSVMGIPAKWNTYLVYRYCRGAR